MSTGTNEIAGLMSAFSEFRGEMRAEIKHLNKGIETTSGKIDSLAKSYVPRPEYDQMNSATAARLKSLEDSREWIIKAVIGAWLSGLGVVLGCVFAFSKILTN